MGSPRTTIRTLELGASGSATDTLRTWDAPCSTPIENLTIWATTNNMAWPATGDLDLEVFYGGSWTGTAFDSSFDHLGGESQHTLTILGGNTIDTKIFEDNDILPTNRIVSLSGGVRLNKEGLPIVVEATNGAASAATLYLIFISETLAESL